MRILAILTLALLFVLPGFALSISLFPLGTEQRYLENESQDLYVQKMDSTLSAAFSFSKYQLGIESTKWSRQSSAPLVSYNEAFTEINSTHLFLVSSFYERLHFYTGLGLGVYESKLKTSFNGLESETNSGQIIFASGIASLQFIYSFLHAALDFRLLMNKDYHPHPTPSVVFKFGLTF